MRNIYLCGAFVCVSLAAGCNTSSNVAVNVNRSANNANTAVVTNANNANSGGSVTNSISNAVGSVTTPDPAEFMTEAASGGLTEVELGKLASTKATNPEVKKFAQMMVADHTKANTELKALAAKKNVNLPAQPDSDHQSMITGLQGKSGADFDADYVEAMVDDHEEDVAAFEKQAQNSTDPDVKAFAAKTLPTLRKHLETIKAIQAKMP